MTKSFSSHEIAIIIIFSIIIIVIVGFIVTALLFPTPVMTIKKCQYIGVTGTTPKICPDTLIGLRETEAKRMLQEIIPSNVLRDWAKFKYHTLQDDDRYCLISSSEINIIVKNKIITTAKIGCEEFHQIKTRIPTKDAMIELSYNE